MAALSVDAAIAVAAEALSRRAGLPIGLCDVEQISGENARNRVLRARAVQPDGADRSVIVKATLADGYDPTAADAFEASGFVREWAALRLLAQCVPTDGGGHGAALLGGDPARGVLVLADLGRDHGSLVRPLLHGSAAEAEAALVAHATALATLHAATPRCREPHAAAVRETFPAAHVPHGGARWIERTANRVATLLGDPLPQDDIALIAERLRAPGEWLALVHGDPCPDNTLLVAGRATLIDYEFAAPGHALLDGIYARMGMPTCWCAGRVPEAAVGRIEAAWRETIADAVPGARDPEAFGRESAIISAAWLLNTLALPWLGEATLTEDGQWGIASTRGRVLHYLTVTIRVTEEAGVLPGLRRRAAEWLDRLGAAWPATAPLAPYPAFAG